MHLPLNLKLRKWQPLSKKLPGELEWLRGDARPFLYLYGMKTLVIHPLDPSTEFLREIYANINCTVVRHPHPRRELDALIESHDQVIGLGHGSPQGLFGWWGGMVYAIGALQAPLLADKEHIYIWCHADQYVKKHNLKGFSSGMFISEVAEAQMYGINAPRTQVEVSNYAFAYTLGRCLEKRMGAKRIYETVTKEYFEPADPVVTFNAKRMIYESKNMGKPVS